MQHNLEIPKFLLYEAPKSCRRKKYVEPKHKWKEPKLPFSKNPPKSKSWAGATRTEVILGDECTKIGSGYRHVWVKRGTKWVRLCDAMGNKGKMRVKDFNRVIRKEKIMSVYAITTGDRLKPKFAVYESAEVAKQSGNGYSIVEKVEDLSDLRAFPTQALVNLYNQTAERKVTRFRDRATAERKVFQMLSEQVADPVESESDEQEPTQEVKAKRVSFKGKMIEAICKENPRRAGTGGFKSMQILIDANGPISFEDFLEAGGRRVDFAWDLEYDDRVKVLISRY
jgi:hypothetical protein